MSETPPEQGKTSPPAEPTPPGGGNGLEIVIAVILALAALASTWCGYQASRWDRMETIEREAADNAERQAGEQTILAMQVRTFEGIQLLEYWRALRENDHKSAETLRHRMRPVLRNAIDAAIADGLFEDTSVPGPLQRPDYVIDAAVQAELLRKDAERLEARVREAGDASSNYVLLTLLFGMVLFFGGITGTFSARRIRVALGGVAVLLFLLTFTMLVRLPVFMGT